jgi:hypothetical protein
VRVQNTGPLLTSGDRSFPAVRRDHRRVSLRPLYLVFLQVFRGVGFQNSVMVFDLRFRLRRVRTR